MIKKSTKDPFAPGWLAQINTRKSEKAPRVKRMTRAKLIELVAEGAAPKFTVAGSPSMELSARHPFDPAGFMDAYRPGRWDCEYDLVFMHGIVQTGPSPGMWEGTVIYARFKAPAGGAYLVLGNFSGHQTTMSLHGPWGTSTAYTPTTQVSAAVTALWTGASGQHLFFTLNCTGLIGYLESIQVFKLS